MMQRESALQMRDSRSLHVDITMDTLCAMVGMHPCRCGGQDYKQRLVPYKATRVMIVLALPTSLSQASSPTVVLRQLRPVLPFSAKCRQQAYRHCR